MGCVYKSVFEYIIHLKDKLFKIYHNRDEA